MNSHLLFLTTVVAILFPATLYGAELHTYQFLVGDDRPFQLYAESGLLGRAKLSGTFAIELDSNSNTSRITQIDTFFVDPIWNQSTATGQVPPYLVGELDNQPWIEVWPNDLTRLSIDAISDSVLRVYGPGASWGEVHFPVREYPHTSYFTDLSISLSGSHAVLNGTARFRGDDGTDYDLINAVAFRVVPEPASFWGISLMTLMSLASARRKAASAIA
jgi:hypothetical protein